MLKSLQMAAVLSELFFIILASTAINMNSSGQAAELEMHPGLYFYNQKEISLFFERIGYPSFAREIMTESSIQRNSGGTTLRFFNWSEKIGIAINSDGSIVKLNIPGDGIAACFNDDNQAVAWIEDHKVHFKNGDVDDTPLHAKRADYKGKYYFKGKYQIQIFFFEYPEIVSPKINLLGTNSIGLFSKDEKIYLFDIGIVQSVYDREPLEAFILQIENQSLKVIREFTIPFPTKSSRRPYVVDLSPWGDNVLICDPFDFPSRSKWYEYNLQTGEMKKMGTANNFGFYLQCDILQSALNNIKK